MGVSFLEPHLVASGTFQKCYACQCYVGIVLTSTKLMTDIFVAACRLPKRRMVDISLRGERSNTLFLASSRQTVRVTARLACCSGQRLPMLL